MKRLMPLCFVLLIGAGPDAEPMTPGRDFYLSGIDVHPGEDRVRRFCIVYRDPDLRGMIRSCVVEEGDAIPGTGWVFAYVSRSTETDLWRALVVREDGRKLAVLDMPVAGHRYRRSPRR